MARWIVFTNEYIIGPPEGADLVAIWVCDDKGWNGTDDYPDGAITEISYDVYGSFMQSGDPRVKYDVNGNLITYYGVENAGVVAVDKYGHIYAASLPVAVHDDPPTGYNVPYNLDFFRKYRTDGIRISDFPQLHGALINCITLDDAGNIFVGGEAYDSVNYYVARKYNSEGILQFSLSQEPEGNVLNKDVCYAIALDSSGNIYTAGGAIYNRFGVLQKFNSSGVRQWEVWTDATFSSMVLDDDGNIYVGCTACSGIFVGSHESYATFEYFVDINTYYNIVKWNNDGEFVEGIAIGRQYTGNNDPLVNPKIEKGAGIDELEITYLDVIDGSGKIVWDTYDLDLEFLETNGEICFSSLAVDSDGNHYINRRSSTLTVRQIGKSIAIAEDIETQSLAIPLSLSAPTWQGDFYSIIPSLSLRISTSAPKTIREYIGPPELPSIYRCFLSGTTNLVLPISSIQCRYTTEKIWFSVVVPSPESDLITEIEARVGNVLTIERGIKFLNGNLQMEVMLSAVFETLRYDVGANSFSLILDARDDVTANPNTRTLRNISYRSAINGTRLVRCAVDTFLRPGDTAYLGGGETMVADAISYTISATSATMEVTEAI